MYSHCSQVLPFLQFWGSAVRQYWTLFTLGLGYSSFRKNPLLLQCVQTYLSLGIVDTILPSYSTHFLQCKWVRLSHDYHTYSVWALTVRSLHHWYMPGVSPWSIFHQVTLGVFDSGCIPNSSLAPLFYLGRAMLYIPWEFRCSWIERHWSCLWRTVWALKFFPSDCLACGWLHLQPKDTMLSST